MIEKSEKKQEKKPLSSKNKSPKKPNKPGKLPKNVKIPICVPLDVSTTTFISLPLFMTIPG